MLQTKFIPVSTILLIAVAALLISLPTAFSSEPCYPDGQRYAFNGILLHDMIHDGAIFHPIEYAERFYARYPAINLPYGPPFFALLFAAVFSIFGISFSAARCVVAVYTVWAALMCWYLVYNQTRTYFQSILAVAGFLCAPIIAICARDPGPELPVIFYSFLAAYFFYNYIEYDRNFFALCGALILALGYLTKQYVVPLGLTVPLYILVRKKWYLFKRFESWLALLILASLTVPYTLLTFQYSNEGMGFFTIPPVNFELVAKYPKLLISEMPVFSLLALLGIIIGMYKRSKPVLFSLLWIVSWYMFHTFYFGYYIGSRYLSLLYPAMILPFSLACYEITVASRKVRLDTPFVCVIAFWLLLTALSTPVFFVRGYEEAGKYVGKHLNTKAILYYGKYEGSFMMGLRRQVVRGSPVVLRGDRQLAIRHWFTGLQKRLVNSVPDVIDTLTKNHVLYVVIEKNNKLLSERYEYNLLLNALQQKEFFTYIISFPLASNYTSVGTELAVYRFHPPTALDPGNYIEVPVPTLNKSIRISL
jgi:hypothetical protein